MDNMYSKISNLCAKHGISGYKLCKELGIQPSILTDLKMGRQKSLSAKNIDKLSKFFGVSSDYFLDTVCLSIEQQENIANIFSEALNRLNISSAFAISRSGIKKNFFPRLQNRSYSVASTSDILALAKYLEVESEILSIISEQKNTPTPKNESGQGLPAGYDKLTPENKAIVDRLIVDLANNQSKH